MTEIAKVLMASGITGLVVALVLFVFLVPAIKSHIEHSYQKLLENLKTDQTLIHKRYDLAATAMKELTILHQELLRDLSALPTDVGEKAIGLIIHRLHPTYRSRFRIIRSQLEPANDLLSFYSLSFDTLLHPQSIKRILHESENLKSAGDFKFAYRSIWLLIIESLHSLLRVSASHRFWNPHDPYPERARCWAEHEREVIEKHFVDLFSKTSSGDGYFALQIEKEGGIDRFWNSYP